MSQKFLIELDDKRMDVLNKFKEKANCKSRVDTIRLLIDLINESQVYSSEAFTLISLSKNGAALLKIKTGGGITAINSRDSEISEWDYSIKYRNGVIEVAEKQTKSF